MKRKLLRFFVVSLLTLTVVAGGFLLPGVVSGLQENSLAQNVSYHEIDQAQLTVVTTNDNLDVFRFAASGFYFSLDLAEGNEYTEATMTDHVFETLGSLVDEGFAGVDVGDYSIKTVEPKLAVNEDEQEARVLWECFLVHFGRAEENFYLVFDDASGTLLGLEYSAVLSPEYKEERQIDFKSGLEWAEALSRFYQLDPILQSGPGDESFIRTDLAAYSPLSEDLAMGYGFFLEGASVSSSQTIRDIEDEFEGEIIEDAWMHFTSAPFFFKDISFDEENGIDPALRL